MGRDQRESFLAFGSRDGYFLAVTRDLAESGHARCFDQRNPAAVVVLRRDCCADWMRAKRATEGCAGAAARVVAVWRPS
jgi:hypothetical protein